MKKTIEERFWNKVKKTEYCWNWTTKYDTNNYGQIEYNGVIKKAHRYSYELHYGKIDNGLFVCHKCDNPSCVRPDHLFLGTNKDNCDDRDRKGRNINYKGEQSGASKLKELNVISIRKEYSEKQISQRELAKKYSISQATVWQILKNITWNI